MIGADQLDDVVDVVGDCLRADVVVAEEDADAVDADDAAGLGAATDQIVGDVARMISQCARVRVREDDGLARHLQHVARGAIAGVRQAFDEADAIHLGDRLAAEVGEAFVFRVVDAGADLVPAVVDEQHPADAEIDVELKHAQLIAHREAAFDVEEDGEFAFGFRARDVGDFRDQDEIVRAREDVVAQLRRHTHLGFEGDVGVADVDGDDVDA